MIDYWDTPENVTKFFTWAEKELGIETKDDWYKVTAKELEKLGGHALVSRFNTSVYNAMMTVYPEHKWLAWKFVSGVPNGTSFICNLTQKGSGTRTRIFDHF